MDRLPRKFIKPESVLIEKTALSLATTFYEIGRGQGLTSRYKDARSYARRHVKEFIPKAVELLMDILANPQTPIAQRDAIMDAFLERVNDKDLASTGLPVFDNPFADKFTSDKVVPQSPLVINSKPDQPKKPLKDKIEDLPLSRMLHEGNKYNG